MKSLVLVVLIICYRSTEGERTRDLSSVTYRFTTCDSSGRLGPSTDQQCLDYHQTRGTPVARDGILIPQTSPKIFIGGQLAKIPRTATYNVTLAGASGGRGLCSNISGRGIVIRARVILNENFRLLILVGQRGKGPCSTSTEIQLDSICSSLPENDPKTCNETWWNYLESTAGLRDGSDLYEEVGGGGGGGTSMIRLENDEGLQIFPLLVAGGGGGGASLLDLDVLDQVNFTRPLNASREEVYQAFVDAKIEDFDLVISNIRTQRGYVAPQLTNERTAGAGGGYYSGFEEPRRVDGSQLFLVDAFGEGGVDCGTTFLVPTPFTSEVGGFGVGGGGCGGGGGGGGQTGGAVVGGGNTFPGGGGYSFAQISVEVLGYDWNEGDGFVEIVPADCGCSFKCHVLDMENKFWCLCPESTLLAPDMSDCYQFTKRMVSHTNLVRDAGTGIVITAVDFGTSVRLYSIIASLTSNPVNVGNGESGSGYSYRGDDLRLNSGQQGPLLCAIVFVGENNKLILASNVASRNGQKELTELQSIEVDFSSGLLLVEGELVGFLPSPMEVQSALLISQGDCFVKGDLHMNTSIITDSQDEGSGEVGTSVEEKILANPQLAARLFMMLLQNDTSGDNDSAPILTNLYIGLLGAGGGVVLSTLLVFICICVCCYKLRQKKRKKRLHGMSRRSGSIVSSLTSNAVYISAHRHSVFPQSNYHKYSNEVQQNCFEMERSTRYGCSPSTRSQIGLNEVEEEAFSTCNHNFSTYNRSRSKSTLHNSNWQFPRNKLIYMRELGEGQFGKVLLMKAENGIAGFQGDIAVAVKTLSSRDPETVAKFMDEADLMRRFSHPNIVSLLGVSTNDVLDDDNAPLIILEYMAFGDLHAFLVKNRPGSKTLTVNLDTEDFISFARDVAEALKFLTVLRYVHRDIAARNCLVGGGLRIKISDFGLARRLNSGNYYPIEEGSVLPIRSTAPEIFLTGRYTTASDVWSYGVLLGEIVSYGEAPLAGLSSRDIAEQAQMGQLHHDVPPDCPDLLSSVMTQCHSHHPSQRPTFTDIIKLITQQQQQQHDVTSY